MKRIIIIFILTICCDYIFGQTNPLFENSKEYFYSNNINLQKKGTAQNYQFYYVRDCYTENEDFKRILQTIADSKPYLLIYRVNVMTIDNKNFITFAQYQEYDEAICEIFEKKLFVEGCITVNNAKFYIMNKMKNNSISIIDKLITKSDSYNAIMKMNYPEEKEVFFMYNRTFPMYIIDEKGHISEYKRTINSSSKEHHLRRLDR